MIRLRSFKSSALLLSLFAGCTGEAAETDSNSAGVEQALSRAQWSYVSDTVVGALAAASSMEGRTWNVTQDNRFERGWLVQTPQQLLWGRDVRDLSVPSACRADCDADFGRERCEVQADCDGGGICRKVAATVTADGSTPRMLCVGHSDAVADQVYDIMVSGTKFVDVTSLTPPDGLFRAAVRNAITRLSKRKQPPQVRLLFGSFSPPGAVNTRTQLRELTRDVQSSSIDVALGAFRSANLPPSWNHTKIVAADGRDALVGGHNLWSQHYLQVDPVHDTSMRVRGSAAGDAQRFVNDMWKYTCENMTLTTWITGSVWTNRFVNGRIVTGCPKPYDLPSVQGPEGSTVISVGRLGFGIAKDANQSDVALTALIRAARHTLRLSLQDFGPIRVPVFSVAILSWPEAYIAELARAVARGVHVHMVLSNEKAVAGGLSPLEAQYANGWTLADVGKRIRSYMETHEGFARGAELTEQLCSRLHLAPFRYSDSATWASGASFANHDKVVIADDQGFYIGSQNLYPANLQEFGYIVDDSRVTAQLLARHWDRVWTHAAPHAVSGRGATRCEL